MRVQKDNFHITDNKSDVKIDFVETLLRNSYWAETRSLELIKISIENSICFSLFKGDKQIGFARVVTDYATFGYLADVLIEETQRGFGLGKWLVETIIHDKRWVNKLQLLATRDAHSLYERYGFTKDEFVMGRFPSKLKKQS